MKITGLSKTILVLLLFFLVIGGLVLAKEFLVPLTFAGILAMLFLPLSQKMERRGINRGFAVTICLLIFLSIIAIIGTLLGWQLSGLATDISEAKENISGMLDKTKQFIARQLGIPQQKQEELIRQQQSDSAGKGGQAVQAVLAGMGAILTNFILVMVYTVLLLYFRTRLREFVLRIAPAAQKAKADKIMYQSTHVSKQYLTGLAIMIGCLWILYGVGFSIVGVKHALFFAVLCGILEMVPFVGNLTGTTLTVLMALTQGGGANMVLGVIAVYAVVQFIQSYFLETLVVGSEVNINPLFTIIGLVLGELIWGIPGMILAIPLLGIAKIIFDNIQALEPYGYLVGQDKDENKWKEKIKKLFRKSKG